MFLVDGLAYPTFVLVFCALLVHVSLDSLVRELEAQFRVRSVLNDAQRPLIVMSLARGLAVAFVCLPALARFVLGGEVRRRPCGEH